jgi:hypothetical protein
MRARDRIKQIIDARLSEAEEDIKAGRVYGPFESAKELIRDLQKRSAKRRKAAAIRRKSDSQ